MNRRLAQLVIDVETHQLYVDDPTKHGSLRPIGPVEILTNWTTGATIGKASDTTFSTPGGATASNTSIQKVEIADSGMLMSTNKRIDFYDDPLGDATIDVVDNSLNSKADVTVSVQALRSKFRKLLLAWVNTFGEVPTGLEDEWASAFEEA